ncbi:MAG: GNAT family N-acetyltransferase, partial [Clostridiales bacterium]|nr:GNAT family N-acetyltransferase [Clostridiales bacterium]
MAQLKMYFKAGTPFEKSECPEGYSITNYSGEDDIASWIDCCKNGLIGDDAGKEAFVSTIIDHDDLDPFKDVFFLDFDGEHIGTATAVYHPGNRMGEMHMVGIKREYRGKGLIKYLNDVVIDTLLKRGAEFIYLTTDEWRKAAVKGYLTAGFQPVEYDEGMEERWEKVLTEYDIDSVEMLNEDGSFYKTVRKRDLPKIRIGVFGTGRGKTMMNFCEHSDKAELVAVCDGYKPALEFAEKGYGNGKIKFYDSFDEFINHDMDAVVLANFANEHTPYAIKCLKKGLNVISEVLPVQTMKEAVELIEAVEESGKLYAYAENYCYMPAPRKMRELVKNGVIGEFEYGEGEYMHNCESIWD